MVKFPPKQAGKVPLWVLVALACSTCFVGLVAVVSVALFYLIFAVRTTEPPRASLAQAPPLLVDETSLDTQEAALTSDSPDRQTVQPVVGRVGTAVTPAPRTPPATQPGMTRIAVGDLPALGSDIPSSLALVEPPLRFHWTEHSAFAYEFTLNAKISTQSVRSFGRTTFTPSAEPPWDEDVQTESDEGSGTGFIVHPQGVILTCAHVVQGATRIQTKIDGKDYEATVIALHPGKDLALLRVSADRLPYLEFADSDALHLAQEVRALGYPLSTMLGESIKATRGEITGISEGDGNRMLQIDATINPGNSGGPLLDRSGRVIGLTSQLLVGEGIADVGFAIPSNEAIAFAGQTKIPIGISSNERELTAADLVGQASPAVVLLKVECGPGGVGLEQPQVLGFSGFYSTTEGTGARYDGGKREIGKLVVDKLGQITAHQGELDLPFLMGNLGAVGIETLPPDSTGEVTNTRSIILQRVDQQTVEMPSFDLRSRYGYGPRSLWPESRRTTKIAIHQGLEKVSYRLGDVRDDVVELKKTYDLRVAGDSKNDPPYLTMLGKGTARFDKRLGLIQSLDYQATLTTSRDNITVRVPITMTYKLRPMEDVAKEQADMKAQVAQTLAASQTLLDEARAASPPRSGGTPRSTPAPSSSPPSKYPQVSDVAPSQQLDLFDPEG